MLLNLGGHVQAMICLTGLMLAGAAEVLAGAPHTVHAPIRRSKMQRRSLSLTELANVYNSDKGTRYKCSHGYTKIYERIFRNLRIASLLEIGLNRDGTDAIPSLSMWRAYFPGYVQIHGFDIEPEFMRFNDPAKAIYITIGDQSVPQDLSPLTKHKYDLILDDGLHASKHQQVSLSVLWDSLNSGGVYIIEDLHVRVDAESGLRTRELLRSWQRGEFVASAHISKQRAQQIGLDVAKIEFFDSSSPLWSWHDRKAALAVIYKK